MQNLYLKEPLPFQNSLIKENTQINHLHPKDDLTRQKHVIEKYKWPKSKFTIHFIIFNPYIYIYIYIYVCVCVCVLNNRKIGRKSPFGVIAEVLDTDLEVIECGLPKRYYGHFRSNIL